MTQNIEKLEWKPSLTLHDRKVDEQHRELFELINNIIEQGTLDARSAKFVTLLNQLTDYGLQHFETEEDLMLKLNYPNYESHKQSHKKYTYNIAMFNFNFHEDHGTDPNQVINFIRSWWLNHILSLDAEFGKYVNQLKE
jgi:hemerythrin-like metal-binding protein